MSQSGAQSYRGIRGGSLRDHDWVLRASAREYNSPIFEEFDTGLRVTEVPEPATMLLLIAASVGLSGRKSSPAS